MRRRPSKKSSRSPRERYSLLRSSYSKNLKRLCRRGAESRRPVEATPEFLANNSCPDCHEYTLKAIILFKAGNWGKHALMVRAKLVDTCDAHPCSQCENMINDEATGEHHRCGYFNIPSQSPVPKSQLEEIRQQYEADKAATHADDEQRLETSADSTPVRPFAAPHCPAVTPSSSASTPLFRDAALSTPASGSSSVSVMDVAF